MNHFSLHLTRASDGKVFTLNGILAKSTRDWVVGQTYAKYDLTFADIPAGVDDVSMSWHDAPNLHPLPAIDPSGAPAGSDAVLIPTIDVK